MNDHLIRAPETLDGDARPARSSLQANLAQVGVRQNDDVRKISAWVAIAAVPTAIAGIYGMNFRHMPELRWQSAIRRVLAPDAHDLRGPVLPLQALGLAVGCPAMPDDCIFCKIVAGELPAEIVQEDEHTIAFMDINPWTRGHALVIPRNHSRNLYDAPDEDLEHTVTAAKRLAIRMRDTLGCDGINLLNSCEAGRLADRLPPARPRDPALRGRPAPPARPAARAGGGRAGRSGGPAARWRLERASTLSGSGATAAACRAACRRRSRGRAASW